MSVYHKCGYLTRYFPNSRAITYGSSRCRVASSMWPSEPGCWLPRGAGSGSATTTARSNGCRPSAASRPCTPHRCMVSRIWSHWAICTRREYSGIFLSDIARISFMWVYLFRIYFHGFGSALLGQRQRSYSIIQAVQPMMFIKHASK